MILSGEFALLEAEELIPWYDHLLKIRSGGNVRHGGRPDDRIRAEQVEYHTADPEAFPEVRPYLQVMEKACGFADIPLEVVLLEGNPA